MSTHTVCPACSKSRGLEVKVVEVHVMRLIFMQEKFAFHNSYNNNIAIYSFSSLKPAFSFSVFTHWIIQETNNSMSGISSINVFKIEFPENLLYFNSTIVPHLLLYFSCQLLNSKFKILFYCCGWRVCVCWSLS